VNVAINQITHEVGETVTWAVSSSDFDLSGATVTSDLKKAINGSQVPNGNAAVILSLTPAYVVAVGEVAAHWRFEITAAQTAALPSGNYISDARFVMGGKVYVSPAIRITLQDAVTAP
tara:strand:+ start:29133 stop:29486 length:354 start_codon:yes stop_codon:yes gene_type:complete